MEEDPVFATSYDAATATVQVSGDVDEDVCPVLGDDIRRHSDDYRTPVVIDLSNVTYLPSLAVGVLATALKGARRRGSELALVAREGSAAQRVLAICLLPHATGSSIADAASDG